MAEVDIDLYADLDQGFPIKDEFLDVDDITATPSSEPHKRGLNTDTPNHISRRHQLYVGNLTWWTTDQNVMALCHDIGVTDCQDVKFFENLANGQSKGFCVISLASETSMRLCMERLPKKILHGCIPVVTLPTIQALRQFENQQKTRAVLPSVNKNGPRPPGMHQGMQSPMGTQQQGLPRYNNQNPVELVRTAATSFNLLRSGTAFNPTFFDQGGPPHQSTYVQSQNGPHWPGPVKLSDPPGFPEQVMVPQLSEVEFEDIMACNRTISSLGIERAISDAAAGEWTSAMEQLVTAIFLITQSKAAQDERCKILILALQDTLHCIESKNFKNRRERSRSRERSHRRSRRERSTSRTDGEKDRHGGAAVTTATVRTVKRPAKHESDHAAESMELALAAAQPLTITTENTSSRSARPRTSSKAANQPTNQTSKRSYYHERNSYRDRSDRDRSHRSRH